MGHLRGRAAPLGRGRRLHRRRPLPGGRGGAPGTDDGGYGRAGFVTEALRDVLDAGGIDAVYAVGPVPMMKAVSALTLPYGVPTPVSLNAIMVGGTGMCGGGRG